MSIFSNAAVAIAILLAGCAAGVLSMSPPEYDIARALAAITCVLFAWATVIVFLDKMPSRLVKGSYAAGSVALVFLALPFFDGWVSKLQRRNEENDRKTPKSAGVISPDKKLLFSSKGTGATRLIQIGPNGAVFAEYGPEGTPFMQLFGDTDLTVEDINGVIKFSTKVTDAAGNIIAEINRNEWETTTPPLLWDRNYNDREIEVIDPKGNIVLQVKALPDRIQLQGEWHDNKGNAIKLVADPARGGSLVVPQTASHPEMLQKSPPIIRDFRYPSSLHLGELEHDH